MPPRSFVTSDGTRWTVWHVRAGYADVAPDAPNAATEWLAFQNANGSERRQLTEIPARWETMPDERLDLLRRVATPAPPHRRRHSPPPGLRQLDDVESGPEARSDR